MKKKIMLPLVSSLMLVLSACGSNTVDQEETPSMDQETHEVEAEDTEQGTNENLESTDSQESSMESVTDAQSNSNDSQAEIDRATVVEGVNYSDAKVTPEDAYHTFMDSHADSNITEMKMDTKYDELEYKVEGYDGNNEYQMRITASTGDVQSDDVKSLDDDDKDNTISKDDFNKLNDLIHTAMDDADNNLLFKKWSVEDSDGNIEFEIEFKDSSDQDVEYTYDLNSGNLIETGD